jgi:hypothetical protein
MVLMLDDRALGWHEDANDPTKFRYWNGSEWTARAQAHVGANGAVHVGAVVWRKHRRVLDRLIRNPVLFHIGAWLDCSVPLTRGRLRRFTAPVELRTLDQVRSPRNES